MPASGYKLFATGDVLTAADVNNYLMLQTVMVFANAAARTTALSGVLAEGLVSYLKDTDVVEIYTGAAWVSLDDPNAVQNASYYAAGKNAIINSAFNVWQRGTTFSAAGYTADRWYVDFGGITGTASRQATNDTTNLPTIQYCMRLGRNVGNAVAGYPIVANSFETVSSLPLKSQTVTLSFYARAGANFSGASNQIIARVTTGTGTDQNVASSYTGSATPISATPTLTTTWQRFSYSATLASTTNEVAVSFLYLTSGTAGAADYFEITGVQLEIGSTATAFQTASGTIGGEIALCQRYYVSYASSDSSFPAGFASTTTQAYRYGIALSVPMRGTPSVSNTGTLVLYDGVTTVNVTSVGGVRTLTSSGNVNGLSIDLTVASGLTVYRPYILLIQSSSLILSAEL